VVQVTDARCNNSFKPTRFAARLNSGVASGIQHAQVTAHYSCLSSAWLCLGDRAGLPDDFNALFAMTCMKYFYSQGDLRKTMAERNAEVPSGEQAEYFLGGQPGGDLGHYCSEYKYVVSLRDDTLCAVFARRAISDAVQRGSPTGKFRARPSYRRKA
jgi:hypothetical protein